MPENCASSCRAPCSTPGTVGQLLGCPGTRRCAGGAAGRPTCQVGTGEPASTIQISFDLPVECSLICSKGAEGVGSIGGGHRTREGKRRASGRTRGGPVKKRGCGVLVFLVCCAVNLNLDPINNVYSHVPHHTCLLQVRLFCGR